MHRRVRAVDFRIRKQGVARGGEILSHFALGIGWWNSGVDRTITASVGGEERGY